MNAVTLNAYAKINLSLNIIGKLENGYHELEMIMQSVSLHDVVTVMKTSDEIRILCDNASVPTDRRNIAYKCAEGFFARYGIDGGALIEIKKNIPSQAGMAGGSADGAAVLHALNKLYDIDCSEDDLIELGVKFGADIPFCIKGGTLLARGVGEKLSQLSKLSDCYIAIAKPDCGVNTANAFAKYDASGANYSADTDGIIAALDKNDPISVGALLGNALESVCIPNESEWIKKQMLKHSAYGAVMTGSGSAVFGLFGSKSGAQNCLDNINAPFKALCVPEPAGIKIVKTE